MADSNEPFIVTCRPHLLHKPGPGACTTVGVASCTINYEVHGCTVCHQMVIESHYMYSGTSLFQPHLHGTNNSGRISKAAGFQVRF